MVGGGGFEAVGGKLGEAIVADKKLLYVYVNIVLTC